MSGGNSDIQKVIQDVEALRDRMDAQEAANRTLVVNKYQRFQRLDQRFDEMINRFDALGVNANRNRNDGGQQPRDQLAQSGVANVPVVAKVQNQIAVVKAHRGVLQIGVKLHRDGIKVLNGRKIIGPGKKVAESKEGQKAGTNPHPGHKSNEFPTRKPINVVERDKEETFCSKFKDSYLEFLVERSTLRQDGPTLQLTSELNIAYSSLRYLLEEKTKNGNETRAVGNETG
ncbi:hypothetical protein M9H77_17341 [Catharanthus roseus]|uniref:Uncharacterized protein n=1 Tax=Catharanthus roseus TaxID=4058 RepID=A0ACC0B4A9_CATRO|nr:hypothetical protein M9H77_17341 [Catharanthus roseus]